MPSLTTISFPPAMTAALQDAMDYYRFENFNQFFRLCAHMIIEHHKHKDTLTLPLTFLTAGEGDE